LGIGVRAKGGSHEHRARSGRDKAVWYGPLPYTVSHCLLVFTNIDKELN